MSLTLWPHTFWGQVGAAVGLAVAALALLRGRAVQRIAGLGILLNYLFTVTLQDRQTWRDHEHSALFADGALFLLFLVLALRHGRPWLIAAAAAQLLLTLTHLQIASTVNAAVGPRAYHTAVISLTFLMLGAVLVGALQRRSGAPVARERRSAPPKPS